MSKSADVPLSKEALLEIEKALVDVDDPALRAALERKLRAKAQSKENESALYRRAFRDALQVAKDRGDLEPEQAAGTEAHWAVLVARHEQAVARIMKKAKRPTIRRADKAAKNREATSKTAQPSKRRFPDRDRRYTAILGSAEKDGTLSDARLVGSKIKSDLGSYRPPHWEKATTAIKVMAMSMEIAKRGAWAINLRLSPSVCATALASQRGPASVVQHRIREAMKREFSGVAPEFWFVVERDSSDRFHIHGAVEWSGDDGEAKALDRALRSAGGAWLDAGNIFQQKGRHVTDPFVWASYCLKNLNLSATSIDRKLFASTAGLRDAARGRWDVVRASLPTGSTSKF